MTQLLRMTNVSLAFPGVQALLDTQIDLNRGEVLGLLGENGAGKSTLMNVLGGIHLPDTGTIAIDDVPVEIRGVISAQDAGIAFIHQELALVPQLSVAENIYLGRELSGSWGAVSQKAMEDAARTVMDELGMTLNPATPTRQLSTGQQQMVEIAKAMALHAKIIVMDEPTSSLSEREVELLFGAVERLRTAGIGLIYISHKMSEIFRLTDRVTVMRDGQWIGTRITAETDEHELIRMMVGRELDRFYTRDRHSLGELSVEVVDYRVDGGPPCSFHVHQGEIVGFYGLIGSGRSELMQAILGLDQGGTGTVRLLGADASGMKPERMSRFRIAMVPEDRKRQGLFFDHSVAFNASIAVLDKFITALRVRRGIEQEIVDRGIANMRVKTSHPSERIGNLSGGNQQKVVLARWLATDPAILILDEPTRGIDVGAKAEIYGIMNSLTKQGMSIILVSSDLPEVMNMADRMMVMNGGAIVAEFAEEDFNEDAILTHAIGGVAL